ncbi:MAG TPA: MazG nucleotide pyrophosphohydrolase domain-containing protein [Euzebyales bacterium]|nr:MazG nucleotide pyrophosphohydrolase domain-containing protein [Euzebyales bacterium]
MDIATFQQQMQALYGERDRHRGPERTFVWFTEECGELARAVFRERDAERMAHEFSDVLAWLASLANLAGVDLADAARRYAAGCPRCGAVPCGCALAR